MGFSRLERPLLTTGAMARRTRTFLLVAMLLLWTGAAGGAEMLLSREVAAHGDDVAPQLDSAVAEMKQQLQSQGCGRIVVAYWSESVPLRHLLVEVRCRDGEKDDALAALPVEDRR